MHRRFLIVDDEPMNLTVLEAVLEPLGSEVVRAGSGHGALAALERQPFDIVLLDMMMPDMSGIDVLRIIRDRAEWCDTPVIIVTAAYDREARLRGIEAGADEFLEKPIDRGLLLTRVRTLLRLREARQQAMERARALEVLNNERRELMNLIVHDLKNPLSIINANLHYLQAVGAGDSQEVDEALQDALMAGDRMKGLIIDILSVERMDRAELSIRRQEVNVAAMVEEVARAHRREAEFQQLKLTTQLLGRDGTLRGDGELIRRVIENLVENALHHTPRNGAIELLLENAREFSIVISNTGTPIPESLRPSLFEKFTRGEGDTTTRFGLGLYFCKRVAAAHHGSLQLVDRPGWPVSFQFAVPNA